jgi:hypothetical protein
MASTIGQRTKTYFGFTDGDELTTSTSPSVRRQLGITAVWLLAGIMIWVFWSATFGRWLVFFGLAMLVVVPLVRFGQRKADGRRGRPN